MVLVKAFKGLRPKRDLVAKVAAPPYDVLSSEEARQLTADNPISFLYVTKPEISYPRDAAPAGADIYETARKNLQRLIADKAMIQDDQDAIYVYRLAWRGHQQTGFMLLSAADDYLEGRIKRHEFTRPDKEADRTRLGEVLNAQAGPVFLFYPETAALDSVLDEVAKQPPEFDYDVDNVWHQLWVVTASETISQIVDGFRQIGATYIADGHHRCAAAVNLCKNRRAENPDYTGKESFNYFLSVIFPANQLRILPYNRVVTDLHGHTPEAFLELVGAHFTVEERRGNEPVESEKEHLIGMYLEGKWYRLTPHLDSYNQFDPIERLDISILSKNVLDPVLGITKPRTDKRIDFIGGIRGTTELVRLVDCGSFKVAFSMPPVSMTALKQVADSGGVMPPKSTWFEPKLRSGMVVHLLQK
jgi:uncharacterized protein (DUF1015 family)